MQASGNRIGIQSNLTWPAIYMEQGRQWSYLQPVTSPDVPCLKSPYSFSLSSLVVLLGRVLASSAALSKSACTRKKHEVSTQVACQGGLCITSPSSLQPKNSWARSPEHSFHSDLEEYYCTEMVVHTCRDMVVVLLCSWVASGSD